MMPCPGVAVFLAAMAFSASPAAHTGQGTTELRALVEGNNRFALNLYAMLKNRSGNLCVSPYGVSATLAMLYNGLGGSSERQMAGALFFSLERSVLTPSFASLEAHLRESARRGGCELQMANALWVQEGIGLRPEFSSVLERDYHARPHEVDFRTDPEAVRKKINGWTAAGTGGRMREIIQQGGLSSLTRLILTDAIYFKGLWAKQFNPGQTVPAPFAVTGKKSRDVAMMHGADDLNYVEDTRLQAIEIPYRGGGFSMLALLPKDPVGLAALERGLTVDLLAAVSERMRPRPVTICLPRFRATSAFTMGDILKSMGMRDLFSASSSDFSGMSSARNMWISEMVHMACAEVNEEGAGAATGVTAARQVQSPVPMVFRADHPFIFLILERDSGAIVFIGRLTDPMSG